MRLIAHTNKLLDKAMMISDFKHMEALITFTTLLPRYKLLGYRDKIPAVYGMMIMLKEIEHDNTIQQHTLLQTLEHVWKTYTMSSNHELSNQTKHQLTIAIATVKQMIRTVQNNENICKR